MRNPVTPQIKKIHVEIGILMHLTEGHVGQLDQ
jgi:hypothetical protein